MEPITDFLLNADPLVIYLLVAVILFFESCAIPLTNTTLLLCVGALASFGRCGYWELALIAISSSIAGALTSYWLGIYGGRPLLNRLVRLLRIDPRRISIMEGWFLKSGAFVVFISRFTPYLRQYACILAGITRMPFRTVALSASLGSLVWCFVPLTIGWFMGSRWYVAVDLMSTYTLPTIIAFVLLAVVGLFFSRWLKRTLFARLFPPLPEESTENKREYAEV